ncbi:hypothetical protein ABW20_dc0110209 [Dactylellina cionopaga]|nr:hypothetical protein ABW20_dc0110209 [Dactylellina cionopaga]
MPSWKSHIRTLFLQHHQVSGVQGSEKTSPKRKKPTREEKGKARATELETQDDPQNLAPFYSLASNSSSSSLTGSERLPIVHYTDLHLVPQILTKSPAFYLVGHPLPPPPFRHAKRLFASPDAKKEELRDPKKSTVRGYNQAKGSGREWWDYDPTEEMLAPDDEEFRAATKEFFEKSIAALQDICQQFNVEEEVVPNELINDSGFSTMRYLRYSPELLEIGASEKEVKPTNLAYNGVLSDKGGDNDRLPNIEAHTDLDALTLIAATDPSGLYVWNRRGKICSAPPIENTVLILAGDLMAYFTATKGKNPLYDGPSAIGEHTVLPTAHTVVVPKGVGERYSIAVFLRPKREMVVSKRILKRGEKEIVEETAFWWLALEKLEVEGRKCFLIEKEDPTTIR